jgi:hypothetical protein
MPTVEARIRTDRAARYLAQLCRHAAGVGVLDQPGRHGDDRPLHDGGSNATTRTE